MPETLPMLETDPRRGFKVSRLLRVALFSFVVATIIVSILIVLVSFLWDKFAVPLVYPDAEDPSTFYYSANPWLILPAIVVIAALLAKVLWDNAEGRPVRRK